MAVLDHTINIYRYFEEISQIPHGSREEKAIADYVESFAKAHELEYVRDPMDNVVIYKEGTLGSEDHQPLMLQAHMDMVNEKNQDSGHDFSKDLLQLYIEDGWLKAKGTTLGADDGYGVAYMLAVLSEESLKHPPLVCVFTVQEEIGLCGAMGLNPEYLTANRLINMDSEAEGRVVVSSSGGRDVIVRKTMSWADEAESEPMYRLEVKGLSGGHSGGEIHREKGNANKIAARILFTMIRQGVELSLAEVTGGLKDNAIPRECICRFSSNASAETMEALVARCLHELKTELEFSDSGLTATVAPDKPGKAFGKQDSKELLSLMFLAPNGLQARSMAIEGLTTVSLNMGVVRTEGSEVILHFSLRSPMVSAREEMTMKLETLAEIFHAGCHVSNDYPGWNYEADSPLRKAFCAYYKEVTGKDVIEEATHGGLETGVFKGYNPDLDIITMGPDCQNAHTPDERMNLESFRRCYEILKGFLGTL